MKTLAAALILLCSVAHGQESKHEMVMDGTSPVLEGRPSLSLSGDRSRIDMLSDAEYESLQKARQALKDAEEAIAKAHRVPYGCPLGSGCANPFSYSPYELRGHFILINVPEANP